ADVLTGHGDRRSTAVVGGGTPGRSDQLPGAGRPQWRIQGLDLRGRRPAAWGPDGHARVADHRPFDDPTQAGIRRGPRRAPRHQSTRDDPVVVEWWRARGHSAYTDHGDSAPGVENIQPARHNT